MTKIEIYPYKEGSYKKTFALSTDEPPYNLSANDVDWEAKPSIAELYNWVNGTVTESYQDIEIFESPGLDSTVFEPLRVFKTREIHCLKAVVEWNDNIVEIEQWRTRVVKEAKPTEPKDKPVSAPYKHPEGKRPTELNLLEINAMINEYNDVFRQYEHLFDEDLKILHKDYIFELRKLFSR